MLKKPGAFKDECLSNVIIELIALRPKLYAYRTNMAIIKKNVKNMSLMKAKGVTKGALKNHITFEDFKDYLTKISL